MMVPSGLGRARSVDLGGRVVGREREGCRRWQGAAPDPQDRGAGPDVACAVRGADEEPSGRARGHGDLRRGRRGDRPVVTQDLVGHAAGVGHGVPPEGDRGRASATRRAGCSASPGAVESLRGNRRIRRRRRPCRSWWSPTGMSPPTHNVPLVSAAVPTRPSHTQLQVRCELRDAAPGAGVPGAEPFHPVGTGPVVRQRRPGVCVGVVEVVAVAPAVDDAVGPR